QRFPYPGPSSPHVPGIIEQVLRSAGQPLDPSIRATFEPRLGRDFGHVRVHTINSAEAAASARSINALAYTAGSDIAFDSGQYSPESSSGRRLLAHDLAHVVQQDSSAHRDIGRERSITSRPDGVIRRRPPPKAASPVGIPNTAKDEELWRTRVDAAVRFQ